MNPSLEKAFRMAKTMTITAAAFVGLIVWLLGFSPGAIGFKTVGEAAESGEIHIFRVVFWGAAVLFTAAFFWLRRRIPAPERLLQSFMGSLALAEVTGIFGALLFGITQNKADLILVALSAGLLTLNFPQRSRWEESTSTTSE